MSLGKRAGMLIAALVLAAAILGIHRAGGDPSAGSRLNRPATVWAVGDAADGSQAATRLGRRIAAAHPALVLYLGDVYPSGSARAFRAHYAPAFGLLARRTAPTPGNHDWPSRAQGYERYWKSVTGEPARSWYALRLGGWTLISLNSEDRHDAGSAQVRWLKSLLRAPGTCRLAFWHRPRYSFGPHGDQPDLDPLWDALRGHAAVVVNGHDHDMQRFRPRDGLVEFVAGAGGANLYALRGMDTRLAFGADEVTGALRLDLRPGQARASFVTARGVTLDASTVRCQPLGG